MNLLVHEGYLPKPKKTPGSHVIFEKDGKRPIPVSASKYIPIGTLRDILKQAGISRTRFWDIWGDI
jgi:predicted RNA binding protein YcfA (HicA-like mRNA interferase family)